MKWKKLGRIYNPEEHYSPNKEWRKHFAQSVSTLVFDDFIRVYFSCRPDNDSEGQAKSYTTYLDLDKKNLFKIIKISDNPVMDLGGIGDFDEFAVYPTSVIKENDKILMYYAGWSRCKSVPFNTSIGLAISDDNGMTFNRIGKGPILSSSLNEPFVISGPKIRKFNDKWYLFYLAGKKWIKDNGTPEIIYKIRMATSTDGINWVRVDKDIISDLIDENECQAGPDVFYLDGQYHMYFVYRHGLNFRKEKNRGYKIGYAISKDLINWERKDDECGIGYSEEGWDSEMHHYPHVFSIGDDYYMLYNGNEFGKNGFGIAILEK
jgi:hypothetical protein